MRRPDTFIVGAPKCGTTAMYEYLGQHPQIFLPAKKEIRFFGSDLAMRGRPERSLDEYLHYFAGATDELRVGTANVWYLYSVAAAREIKAFMPDARIIVMLRDPVDMMYSLHSESLYNGNEDIADFSGALAAEEDRRSGRRIPTTAHFPMGLLYRDVACYATQVDRYLEAFGRERVHLILFDDFASSTAQSYRATLEFLGVDPSFDAQLDIVNPNKRSRSAALRQLLAAPPSSLRRLVRRTLPRRVRRGVYERAVAINTRYSQRAPIDPDLRRRLVHELSDEIGRLAALTGRDLGRWRDA